MNRSRGIALTAFSKHQHALHAWFGIAVSALVLLFSLFAISYFAVNDSANPASAIFGVGEVVCMAIAALSCICYFRQRTKLRGRTFREFIADNEWTAIREYDIDRVAGILLGPGTSFYQQVYGYEGEYNERPFTCVIFQFITRGSEERRFACLNFKLRRSYPMIVVDNRLNDNGYRRSDSNLPARVPKGVSVRLEGDFNKYYNTTTTKGSERAMVQVLSPDVMAALVDCANNKVDIEISDKDLFLIHESDFYTERNIKALFGVADVMLRELNELSNMPPVSNGWEEKMASQTARSARQKLMSGDVVTLILSALIFIVVMTLIILKMTSQS